MDRNKRFLTLAKRYCKKSTVKRQFCALIVDKNRIVSIGINRLSHPANPPAYKWGLHSEMAALLNSEDVRGCSVFVHGENKRSGRAVYSKPCGICQRYLMGRGITTWIFSTQNGYEEFTI